MGKPYTEFQKGLAFDAYFAMGAARDMSAVSQRLISVPEFKDRYPGLRTLQEWSRTNNWQARITQRDIENVRKVEADTDYKIVKEVANSKADHRTAIAGKLEETDKLIQRLTTLVAKVSPRIAKGSGQDNSQPDSDEIKELKIDTIKELNDVLLTGVKLEALRLQLVKADLVIMGEADSRQEHIVSLLDIIRAGREKADGHKT